MARRDAPPPPFSERAKPLIVAMGALALFLLVLEIFEPGYFLHDDNATGVFARAYLQDYRVLTETARFAVINYYQYGGEPFLAQGQTGVLYPPVYLGEFLSRMTAGNGRWAIEWLAALHLLFGLAGCYFWLRENRVQRKLAALSALGWSVQPFVLIVGANWIVAIYAAAWLPWIFWAFQGVLARPSKLSATLLGSATGCFFLQGYVQWVAYTLLFLALYAAYQFIMCSDLRNRRVAGSLLFAMGVFLAWSLPLLLPMWHATEISAARSGAVTFDQMIFYHVENLFLWPAQVGLFRPFMFGISSAIFFCPVLMLWPLALLRYFKAEDETRRALLAFMILALFALIFSGQGHYLLSWVPLFDRFRWPFKIFLLAEFFALSAFAVMLSSWSFGRWRDKQRFLAKAALFLILVAAAGVSVWQHDDNYFSKTVLPPTPPVLPVGLNPHLGRVIAIDDHLPEATCASFYTHAYGTYYQVPSVGGYNPLVSRDTLDFGSGLDFPNFHDLSREPEITPAMRNAWASHAVRYWIVDPHAAHLPDFARMGGLKLLVMEPDQLIFEDTQAVPIVHSTAKPAESIPLEYSGNSLRIAIAGASSPVHVSVGPGEGWWSRADGGSWKKAAYQRDGLMIDFPAGAKKLEVSYFDPLFQKGLMISGLLLVGLLIAIGLQARSKNSAPDDVVADDADRAPDNEGSSV